MPKSPTGLAFSIFKPDAGASGGRVIRPHVDSRQHLKQNLWQSGGFKLVGFFELAGNVVVVWLVSLAIHLLVYIVSTASVIHAYRFFWSRGLAAHKIQERQASPADIRREIRSSLGTVLIFSVIYAGVYFGATAHVFIIYTGIAPLGWPYLVFSVIAMILAHDAYFYWTHRLLHLRPFARFHRTHHQSTTPTAYSCYAFDPSEATLHGLFQPLFLLLMPMQLPALLFAIGFMMVRNILGHSGVELFARNRARRSRWFGWLVTTTDHDLHHSAYNYNFGFHFTWWDRLMGTEHPAVESTRPQRLFGAAAGSPVLLSAKHAAIGEAQSVEAQLVEQRALSLPAALAQQS